MEVFFRSRPKRRPASGLEVLMLSCALGCPEVAIEGLCAASSARRTGLLTVRYIPNMPD